MKQKLSIVTLGVESIEESRKFYEGVLGFKPTHDTNDSVVFYDMGTMQLGLFNWEELAKDAKVDKEGSGFRRFAIAHNEPSKEAVDELFAELKEKEVKIVKEPEDVF